MANTVEIIIKALDATKGGFSSASRSLQSFGKLSGAVMGAAAVGAAVLTSAYASMVKQSIDAADRLNDLSKQSGVSVETLDRMQFAAAQSGASLETLSKAAKELNRSIAEAASNSKSEAAKAFAEMGISARTASGQLKNVDQVMIEMADRFEKQADGAEKVAAAQKLMGRTGAEMIPFLNEGGESIKRMGESIRPVSTEAARMSDEFNDTLGRIGRKFTDFANEVTERSLPALNDLAKWFEDFTAKNYERSVSKIAASMAFLSEAAIALRQLFQNGPDVGEAAFGEAIAKSVENSLKAVTDKLESSKPVQLPAVAVSAKSLEDTDRLAQMYEDLFNSQLRGSARVTAEFNRAHRERVEQVSRLKADDEAKAQYELLSVAVLEQQKTELYASGMAMREDMDTAYALGSVERAALILSSEQAVQAARLQNNQALIDIQIEQWHRASESFKVQWARVGVSIQDGALAGVQRGMEGILKGTMKASEAMKALGQAIIDSVVSAFTQMIAKLLIMKTLGFIFGGGGFLGDLFGFKGGGFTGFASGGYTGGGSTSDIAGVVHRREYVVPAAATSAIGVSALDRMTAAAEAGMLPSGSSGGSNFDGQPMSVSWVMDGQVLARALGVMSRNGTLELSASAIV